MAAVYCATPLTRVRVERNRAMEALLGPALLFRKTDYGEADLILAFFSLNYGKISVIAKSAKNSRKRFGGVLELFSLLDIQTAATSKQRDLPVLNEARILNPFTPLRTDFRKMAYAAYWCDLVFHFVEERVPEPDLFKLLCFFLEAMCRDVHMPAFLSVVFQAKLAQIVGFEPNLKQCHNCGKDVFAENLTLIALDVRGGGVACGDCTQSGRGDVPRMEAGTLKQLLWVLEKPLDAALRARFSDTATSESLYFWEAFLPYHFDKKLKSLDFLRQIRHS